MRTAYSWNKRPLALLLSLCITVCMLPLSAVVIVADTGTDVWDGSTAAEFAGGQGSEEDPYQINTGAQLAYLREQANGGETFEGQHFVLTADLNLYNRDWVPIGAFKYFEGSFDGSGHTISNYYAIGKQKNDTFTRQGLFGTVKGGSISNLTVSNVNISDTYNASTASYVGGLAGVIYDDARVENCHAQNVTIAVGTYAAGGLAGSITCDATNPDPVTGGGLFGCTASGITIEPDGAMTSLGNCGGLVGSLASIKFGDAYTLENCSASGSITTALSAGWEGNDRGAIGGLAGSMMGGIYDGAAGTATVDSEFLIRNCHADVAVTAPNLGCVGGLFGEATALTMEDCSASGDVSGKWSVGGLLGAGAASELRGCHATGNVTAADWHAGGLVGYGPKSTLERCFATGDVTATQTKWKSRAGGLVGNAFGCSATDCYSSGDVVAQTGDVGGLAGWVSNDAGSFTAGQFTNCFAFGKVEESESGNLEYAMPLVNGIWDAGSLDSAKVVNCCYSSQVSGKEDANGRDCAPAQFADGTALSLLGGAFVQIDGAACPTLPIEWSGSSTFADGLYYRISEGKTVRSDSEKEIDPITVPAGSVLEVRGVWEIGRRQDVTVEGQAPCGENGKVVMTAGKTLSKLVVYGSLGTVEALGGATVFQNGSRIGKATVDLPFNSELNAYDQLMSYGAIGELYLKSGAFFNYNNAAIGRATVAGGELNNCYLRYTGMDNLPNPPVIEEALVQGGLLYQANNSDADHEGTPYENPARVKKLTMDMTVPSGTVYNCFGGVIEEALLEGGDDLIDGPDDTATFDNYKGGVVGTLTITGNAGYNIFNRNDSEYGTPVIGEATTDGGYCKLTNDNGGKIEQATIWTNSELVNSRRGVVENAYIHEGNVRNTFHQASNTGGVIEKLFTTDWSSINNWAPAEIKELYADDSGNGYLYISGVNGENPDAASGDIGKLYYRILPDPNAPGTFSMGDNTAEIADAGEDFNGFYGLSGARVGFAFNYTGTGKLTELRMNNTLLTAAADGSYSFTMPRQNAVLSTADRALSNDATLKSLAYRIGGDPVPVPEFTADGEAYTVVLPRSTARDAAITLAGICTDQNASITANDGASLTYGASERPATLTVTAEDGTTTKTYELYFSTEPTNADLHGAAISGVEDGKTFIQNETPAFAANGSGMENENPAVGDERYRPASWRIDDGSILAGNWSSGPFTGTLDLGRLSKGSHTLTVQYNREQFGEIFENNMPTGEYGWIVQGTNPPEELVKTVSFTVDPVTYALTVTNGADKTGGSPYEEGASVRLEANPPAPGYVFDKWVLTSGTGAFEDAAMANATFTMGASDAAVTAIYKDVEAPTGEITIAGNSWKGFLNTITFGIFCKEKQDVTITAEDTSFGEISIEYLLSADALTLEALKAETQGWTDYSGKFEIDPDAEIIVYARLTDAAENESYLSSDGVVLDATPPVIEGARDGQTYDSALSLTVTDAYLKTVTVNGAAEAVENGRSAFSLAQNGTYTITAADAAGNETTAVITVELPPETYTLTFDADGGAPVPPAQTLKEGDKPAPAADPAKQGYIFLGWYDGETKVELGSFQMPAADVELTAKWKKQQASPGTEPKTGEGMPLACWTVGVLAAGAGAVLLRRRRGKRQAK